MLEGLTIEKALAFAGKHWPWLVIAMLGAALAWSRHDLGNARDKIAEEKTFRHSMASVLQSSKDDSSTLLAVGAARMKEITADRTTLRQISDQALADKQRADAADTALKSQQAENQKKFAAAQAQIAALQSHKTTGNRDADLKQIEEDSQAAWKGWK